MQDGATPHTALTTIEFLTQTFGNRVIGKHFSNEWPSQSPDLIPADYYLWPHLKRIMYTRPYLYINIRYPKGRYSSPHERDETLGSQTFDHFSNQQMAVVHRCQGQAVEQIHKWASLVNVIDVIDGS